MYYFEIALTVGAWVAAAIAWLYQRIAYVDSARFTESVASLVRRNNVDRAIKLCEAAPHAMMTKAVKSLLLGVKSPDDYGLLYDAALVEGGYDEAKARRHDRWYSIGVLVSRFALAAAFIIGDGGWALPVAYTAGWLIAHYYMSRMTVHIGQMPGHLFTVLDAMCKRADVIPPRYTVKRAGWGVGGE